MIAIVDYGMGNRRSVEKALAHVGVPSTITSDERELLAADGLILPGVGAFPMAMANLERLGLDRLLRARVADGVPVLGICLGMQLGFDSTTEHGGAAGLGLIPGDVRLIDSAGAKLPHIGWNEVTFTRESPLTDGLGERCAFYHVHSYAAVAAEEQDVLGTADYGMTFASVVARGSFWGVQFHPEKSSLAGLRLLANFAGQVKALSGNAPDVAAPAGAGDSR